MPMHKINMFHNIVVQFECKLRYLRKRPSETFQTNVSAFDIAHWPSDVASREYPVDGLLPHFILNTQKRGICNLRLSRNECS